ncbi:CDP-glycerol glycerophosphotransferase family protein [Mycoplasma sp. P36-A1]|uniref:CDP-glycerol glycerophosphotransferase family protein n=1 Tax=Mycoplasma sp. P36-A1 TaxID=3252900 RepID=UPI003C2F8B6C
MQFKKNMILVPSNMNLKALGDVAPFIQYYKDDFNLYLLARNQEQDIVKKDGYYIVDGLSGFGQYLRYTSDYTIDAGVMRIPYKISPKQHWISVWHGIPYKKMFIDFDYTSLNHGLNYSNAYNTMISMSSYYTNTFLRNSLLFSGEVKEIGCAKVDNLFNNSTEEIIELKKKLELPLDKKILLYAPTFREKGPYQIPFDVTNLKKELEKETSEEWQIITKLHYWSQLIDKNKDLLDYSSCNQISDLMLISDALISDYSSLVLDYALLNKPIFLYQYDQQQYFESRSVYFDFSKYIPSSHIIIEEQDLYQLPKLLKDFNQNKLKEEFYPYETGNSTQNIVNSLSLNNETRKTKEITFLVNDLNDFTNDHLSMYLISKVIKDDANTKIIVIAKNEYNENSKKLHCINYDLVDIAISFETNKKAVLNILNESDGKIIYFDETVYNFFNKKVNIENRIVSNDILLDIPTIDKDSSENNNNYSVMLSFVNDKDKITQLINAINQMDEEKIVIIAEGLMYNSLVEAVKTSKFKNIVEIEPNSNKVINHISSAQKIYLSDEITKFNIQLIKKINHSIKNINNNTINITNDNTTSVNYLEVLNENNNLNNYSKEDKSNANAKSFKVKVLRLLKRVLHKSNSNGKSIQSLKQYIDTINNENNISNSNIMDTKVSIIIINNSSKNKALPAIKAALLQEYTNLEIIYVSNSKDELIDNEKVNQYYVNTNEVGELRIKGLENSTGKYIFYLDMNTRLFNNAINLLVNSAENNNADIVSGKTLINNKDTNKINYIYDAVYKTSKTIENKETNEFFKDINYQNKLYKKELLINNQDLLKTSYYEDTTLNMVLLYKASKINVIKNTISLQNRVNGNYYNLNYDQEISLELLNERIKAINNEINNVSIKYRVYLFSTFINVDMIVYIRLFNMYNDNSQKNLFDILQDYLLNNQEYYSYSLNRNSRNNKLFKSIIDNDYESFKKVASITSTNYLNKKIDSKFRI